MTSSSSSGGPNKQQKKEENNSLSQELEDSVCKASPRKVFCPPYRGIGIDFSHFTRLMLHEAGELPSTTMGPSLFNKKPLLSIAKLKVKDGEAVHLKKDKLSEKLGRRGIKFYDLYRHNKEDKDVRDLQDSGFKLRGIMDMDNDEEEPVFGDIEVDDFN